MFLKNRPFTSASDARRFILGGKATVTLHSLKTDARFTYKVSASKDGAVHFVSLLNGPDNSNSFAYFGYIRRDVFFHGGHKAKVGKDTPSVKAFGFAWNHIVHDDIPDLLEVWHEGRCGRCARKLTVPESIATGFGPECADQLGIVMCEAVSPPEAVEHDPMLNDDISDVAA
jgi:hypothetical protein